MVETEGILGNVLPYISFRYGKMHLISEVSNGNRLFFLSKLSMLKIPVVMMLHKFENSMDSRLGSFGMTAGKTVPFENFYKDPEATKRIKFYVLQLMRKELFQVR